MMVVVYVPTLTLAWAYDTKHNHLVEVHLGAARDHVRYHKLPTTDWVRQNPNRPLARAATRALAQGVLTKLSDTAPPPSH